MKSTVGTTPGEFPMITIDGTSISLTRTQFRLWRVLTSAPGRTFSRAELLSLVIPDAIVVERTIDVHVHHLRKKLGANGHPLVAVRKKGYRWEDKLNRTRRGAQENG